MSRLTEAEKKLRKEIARLVPEASVDISYHRFVTWYKQSIANFKIRPYVSNSLSLRIRISHEKGDPEIFEWEGKKLPDGLRKLNKWNAERLRLKLAPIGLPEPKPAMPLLESASVKEES